MVYYHLGELVHKQAHQNKNKTAIKHQDSGETWIDLSWGNFSDKVMMAAQAMAELGIEPNNNIGIYSQNMSKYLIADFAAYANKAVMVPMYATSSPSQVKYIVEDASIKLIFVGEQFQYNNTYKVQQESSVLKKLIVFDMNIIIIPEDKTSVYFYDFITTGEISESQTIVQARMRDRKSVV